MAPSHTEKENCRKFAKFCFKVIKNECSNIKRAAGIRKEYDATGEEPVEYLLELLAHEDTYTMENLILVVDGKPCAVESEMLFEALKSLPDDQRKVILYDFWLELKDREIAERLEVTVRTVYNLRQRAFKRIKSYYPPYGYDNVDGEMVIVPEQAEIVKQIFADTLAGKSTHEIADELNERGVATKKGGHWTPGTVNAIIGNEKYTGDVLFQKTYTDNSFNRHQNRGELDQYLMQDHHEAIISREKFELANAVLKQRGREKGNGHDTGRYQNRYGFSGRICCGECDGKYKRRMHYKPSGQYVAWACANYLKDKESCSQKYITDDALKLAFVTMMNKLVFGHQMVLHPLLQSLRGLNDQSRLLKIEELETAIEKNREQKQVLTNLMANGYLEPALFNKESNELAAEADTLRQEKDGLMRSVNGDMVKIEELQRLLRFTSKGTMMTEFDDETFLSFVERITVLSRKEVVFELKCGLSLRERLVEP